MALVVVATWVGVLAPCSLASGRRQLAGSTTSFATDGVRYAARQVRAGAPIVALDVATGQIRNITTPGCELESQAQQDSTIGVATSRGGGGRFLLACVYGQQSVLNAQTGQTQPLPHEQTRYEWNAVGAL